MPAKKHPTTDSPKHSIPGTNAVEKPFSRRKKTVKLLPEDALAKIAVTFDQVISQTPAPTTTRERILHAAVTLLNDDGFSSLTQQRVCERAGIRQSHLTYYFPTRNDLLRETAVFGCEAMLSVMAETAKSGQMTLPMMRDLMFTVDESDRRFGRLMTALTVASDEDPRIKPWMSAFEAENRAKLTSLLASTGEEIAQEDVELLHAAYIGAVVLDLGESSEASLARAKRIVHHAFDIVIQKAALARRSAKPTNPTKPVKPAKSTKTTKSAKK